jgi:hypothetical protein
MLVNLRNQNQADSSVFRATVGARGYSMEPNEEGLCFFYDSNYT